MVAVLDRLIFAFVQDDGRIAHACPSDAFSTEQWM
jgi:hypothetical protein